MEDVKLTQFSPGAGCGCKISPNELEKILHTKNISPNFQKLLVGYQSKDDAAVYDIGNGNAIISTTDFFTPIVDDAYDFGRIASVNAISDVYAMGGSPLMAIAILGWPLSKLSSDIAAKVIEGARFACNEAGIPLAGGHSIDIADPIFGLAVTGNVKIENLKQNNTAKPNSTLYLTKPIGIGVLSTAAKRNVLKPEHYQIAVNQMCRLNNAGIFFGKQSYINALTDVTGFGLCGHLLEICEGSNLNAILYEKKIPLIGGIEEYLLLETIPGGTHRNFKSYGHKIETMTDRQKKIYCDPQTSGGLLVSVDNAHIVDFELLCTENQINIWKIGELTTIKNEKYISFIE